MGISTCFRFQISYDGRQQLESNALCETPNNLSIRLASVPLTLPQNITIFFQGAPYQLRLFPQVRRQEAVCITNCCKRSLECIFERLGGAG